MVSIPLPGLEAFGPISDGTKGRVPVLWFQSLFKDYNLSDEKQGSSCLESNRWVSIPLQGLQPFGRGGYRLDGHPILVSIPLQGLQPFGHQPGEGWGRRLVFVSIPLQGLQPFGPNRSREYRIS